MLVARQGAQRKAGYADDVYNEATTRSRHIADP